MSDDVCDVCCGEDSLDCICGGTGTIQGLVTGLRRELMRMNLRWSRKNQALEEDLQEARDKISSMRSALRKYERQQH